MVGLIAFNYNANYLFGYRRFGFDSALFSLLGGSYVICGSCFCCLISRSGMAISRSFFYSSNGYSHVTFCGGLGFLGDSYAWDNSCCIDVLEDKRNLGTKLGGIHVFVSGGLVGINCISRGLSLGGLASSLIELECSIFLECSSFLECFGLLGRLSCRLILSYLIIGICFFFAFKLSCSILCLFCHFGSGHGCKYCILECLCSFGLS